VRGSGLVPLVRRGLGLEVARRGVVPQALGLGLEDAGRTADGAGRVGQLLVTEQREDDGRDDDQFWRTESEHGGPDLSEDDADIVRREPRRAPYSEWAVRPPSVRPVPTLGGLLLQRLDARK